MSGQETLKWKAFNVTGFRDRVLSYEALGIHVTSHGDHHGNREGNLPLSGLQKILN
jgi:hypothetical protein